MELVTAARRYIAAIPAVASAAAKVHKDQLLEKIDGTGKIAVVVSQQPGWATPDSVTHQEFPRLWIDVVSDNSRDEVGMTVKLDAADRARALQRAISPFFTYPRLVDERIGAVGSNPGLRVISSQPWAYPYLITAADQHPAKEGETVTVRAEYALVTLP